MIRAYAFDLDETLVDAEPQHRSATRAMLDALGHPTHVARDVFHDILGRRTRDILDDFRRAVGAPQSTEELLALRHAAFVAALDETPAEPLPGARALLEACRARGRVALVTSGYRDDALETLRSAGLAAQFDAIVTGEDVADPKPSPEPYRLAAARLAAPADEILAFEDSPRGVASARAAGCRVVAIPRTRAGRDPPPALDADVLLASLEEALPLDALEARAAGRAQV